jgi:AcrR family transcriptional regulator
MTKRRPQTQQRILEAALDVFAEAGFQAASIEEICRRAGYTRGAFYSNFASRDELFFALYDAQTDRVMSGHAAIVGALAQRNLTVDRIAQIVTYVDETEHKWYLVRAEFMLHAIRNPDIAAELARREARMRAVATENLTAGLRQAGLRLRAGASAEQLTQMIIAAREGATPRSLIDPESYPAGQLDQHMIRLILAGSVEADSA